MPLYLALFLAPWLRQLIFWGVLSRNHPYTWGPNCASDRTGSSYLTWMHLQLQPLDSSAVRCCCLLPLLTKCRHLSLWAGRKTLGLTEATGQLGLALGAKARAGHHWDWIHCPAACHPSRCENWGERRQKGISLEGTNWGLLQVVDFMALMEKRDCKM